MEERFSRKLVYVNFFLAVLIVITHTYCTDYGNIYASDSLQNIVSRWFLNVFQGYICQIAVPTFFVISGFLFYKNFTIDKLMIKWKSRLKSLLIPYCLWNTFAYLFYFSISNASFTRNFLSMEPMKFTLIGALKAIFLHQYTVLWFVKVLMIFVALAPFFYLLLKNEKVAILAMIEFILLGLFYPHKSINSVLYTIAFYFLGAYLGTYKRNWVIERSTKQRILYCGVAMLATLAVSCFYDNSIIFYIFKFAWVICVWSMFDIIANFKKPAEVFGISFFMYCIHRLYIRIIEKIVWRVMPVGGYF